MWRNSTSRTTRLLNLYSKQRTHVPNRTQSSSSDHGGGSKVLLTVVGVGTLGVGGAVAYASYDRDFRRLLEDNLPYADTIFTYIPDWSPPKPKSAEKPSLPAASDVGLLRKKQERAAAQKAEQKSIEQIPTVTTGTATTASAERAKEDEAIRKKAHQELEARKQALERQNKQKQDEHQNADLENRLNSCRESLDRFSQDSLLSHQRAVEAIRSHATALLKALETDMENSQDAWHEARIAQESKVSALNKATETLLDTKSALESLEEVVKNGKDNPVTGNNSALLTAEEALDRAKKQMLETQARLAEAQNEFGQAQNYQKLLEEGREQLQRELQDILPQSSQGKELTAEDHKILLAHAHQRLLQTKQKLAKLESATHLSLKVVAKFRRLICQF